MKYPYLEDEPGDIIQKARQGKGLDIERLAQETGISVSKIGAIEAYRALPAAREIEALALALDLSHSKLQTLVEGTWRPPDSTAQAALHTAGIHQIPSKGSVANCYAITHGPSSIIVDPGIPYDHICQFLNQQGSTVVAVLLTHSHSDHIGALRQLLRADPTISVFVHQDEVKNLPDSKATPFQTIEDGHLAIGALTIQVITAPGHTSGSCCFLTKCCLFSGDTLFAGSIGRSQAGSYAEHRQIVLSIMQLPPETVLAPGHGPLSTIDAERKGNPFVVSSSSN